MNLIIARNLLLVLLFITPVYSAIDQVQPRALVTTHSPYAYIAADDFDVPMLIFTLVPGQEYEGLMEYVRNNQYNNGFKVHCLFTILWNDFARTKEQLWNVYLLLGLIPHRFRSMYATVAFDLALHIGSFIIYVKVILRLY